MEAKSKRDLDAQLLLVKASIEAVQLSADDKVHANQAHMELLIKDMMGKVNKQLDEFTNLCKTTASDHVSFESFATDQMVSFAETLDLLTKDSNCRFGVVHDELIAIGDRLNASEQRHNASEQRQNAMEQAVVDMRLSFQYAASSQSRDPLGTSYLFHTHLGPLASSLYPLHFAPACQGERGEFGGETARGYERSCYCGRGECERQQKWNA